MKSFSTYVLILCLCVGPTQLAAQDSFVLTTPSNVKFTLYASGKVAPLIVDDHDFSGVIRAAYDLQTDLQHVTDAKPTMHINSLPKANVIVLVGTVGKNRLINQLVESRKIDINDIKGKWETFLIQTIENPFPDVEQAMVIAGSDKRGTIFGIYELSKQIGVSPWYWWADVPPQKKPELYAKPGRYVQGEPSVKYRGIFINDEEPALGRWAVANYGGFTSEFYKKVFELTLRLKGNYLWPAMWWASFNENDSLNPKLADEYGVVIGTTHHEPMNRAHADWKKNGEGAWNYETNEAVLQAFWKEGIERMGDNESIVSLGMRGDGDMAMSKETNIALLERIVKDQREMLANVTGKDVKQTPQLWALYKEVQDYYDQGMRVPDDVTLLLCDDNWGNLRKLPTLTDKPRTGGYGIYYHFDYVGGPRNYKWLNTNPLPRIWEQMHLAYSFGANRIWIVNVGDIKPMELPISFFLDYAWNAEQWNPENLDDYTLQWAMEQFGQSHTQEIAEILGLYSKYNGRRKPELLSADVYSLIHYREAERIVSEYNSLVEKAEKINNQLPSSYKDAFYQLVLHPVKACANLNELWVTVARNRLYAKQGRASTNELADRAQDLFRKDSALSHYYNKIMANGKWDHMMDQTHISYTYWQQPPKDVLPEVRRVELPAGPEMAIAVEGSEDSYLPGKNEPELPAFDVYHDQSFYVDIFNRGKTPFEYGARPGNACIKIDKPNGKVVKEQRILVTVDWRKVKTGIFRIPIDISDKKGNKVVVWATVVKPEDQKIKPTGFIESNGYISIDAENFSKATTEDSVKWVVLPDHGKTSSAVTPSPVTAAPFEPGNAGPRLEYNLYFINEHEVKIQAYFSPTLNFHNKSLRYAVSIDDEDPQVVQLHETMTNQAWGKWVSDNIIVKSTTHEKFKAGNHTLKIWMIDPGVVLQKIVVDLGGLKPSYLGPPQTKHLSN